jgi:hypothetical protein
MTRKYGGLLWSLAQWDIWLRSWGTFGTPLALGAMIGGNDSLIWRALLISAIASTWIGWWGERRYNRRQSQ